MRVLCDVKNENDCTLPQNSDRLLSLMKYLLAVSRMDGAFFSAQSPAGSKDTMGKNPTFPVGMRFSFHESTRSFP